MVANIGSRNPQRLFREEEIVREICVACNGPSPKECCTDTKFNSLFIQCPVIDYVQMNECRFSVCTCKCHFDYTFLIILFSTLVVVCSSILTFLSHAQTMKLESALVCNRTANE